MKRHGWKRRPVRQPVTHHVPAFAEHPDLYEQRLEEMAEEMADRDAIWEREERLRSRDFRALTNRERRAA